MMPTPALPIESDHQRLTTHLVHYARVILAAATVVAVLVIFLRRLQGAFTQPLPAALLVLIGIIVVCCALSAHRWLSSSASVAPHVAVSAVAAMAIAAFWLPDSAPAGLLIMLLLVFGEETWSWNQWTQAREIAATVSTASTVEEAESENVITLDSALSELAFADSSVVQHLVRRQSATGEETIAGCLRAVFSAGERTINLHVPFCPPLVPVPTCEAEALDGPPARVKVVQVLPQGARLEVRLDQPANEQAQVVVDFSAIRLNSGE